MSYCYLAAREAELRQLRKSNTEYEEQNAILTKHIENMKSAIEKLEGENAQHRTNNIALQQHLEGLRNMLIDSFADFPLPSMCSFFFLLQINTLLFWLV